MKKLLWGFALLATLALAATASAATRDDGGSSAVTLAVYGDAPYGNFNGDTARVQETPAFIASINADPSVSFTMQVGDTHSGKDHCYFQTFPATLPALTNTDQEVFDLWQAYEQPLIYTPGDNEWTDCNKKGEGGGATGDGYYSSALPGHLPGDPLDNLDAIRSLFFANPGWSLGQTQMRVQSQATIGRKSERGFPENVIFKRGSVEFVTVNLPGSNNDTLPWYGTPAVGGPHDGSVQPLPVDQLPQRQRDEVVQRTAADLAWLDRAFQEASDEGAGAIVIGTQADMWDPAQVANGEGVNAYDPVVAELARLVTAFGKPVLLINGDSHNFERDNPMSPTSPYYGFHPSTGDVSNFTRITVQGSAKNPPEWGRLTVDPTAATVFSYTRVNP